jgi:hypothetical protein
MGSVQQLPPALPLALCSSEHIPGLPVIPRQTHQELPGIFSAKFAAGSLTQKFIAVVRKHDPVCEIVEHLSDWSFILGKLKQGRKQPGAIPLSPLPSGLLNCQGPAYPLNGNTAAHNAIVPY